MCRTAVGIISLIVCTTAANSDEEVIEQFLFGETLNVVNKETQKTVGQYRNCIQLMPPDTLINEATIYIEEHSNMVIGGMPSSVTFIGRLSLRRLQVYEEILHHNIDVSKNILILACNVRQSK